MENSRNKKDAARNATPLWLRRTAWLLLIWATSVAALGVVAGLLRWVMGWAGMVA